MNFLQHLAQIYNVYVWFTILIIAGIMISDSKKLREVNIREAEFIKNISMVYIGISTFLFFVLTFVRLN